jgi:hypothetical protein
VFTGTMKGNRPEPGPCVHCGAEGERTWDHLLPESWRGTSIPKREWLIPACGPCNGNYGQIERKLRTALCMPLEPDSPGAEGLVEKVWNSLDPARAETERDRSAREKEREVFKENIIFARGGVPIGSHVDGELIQAMIEKFVKGVTYRQDGLFIDDRRYEIRWHYYIEEEQVPEIFRNAAAEIDQLGEALAIRRVTAPDGDKRVGFFEIVLWSRLYFVATCNLRPKYLGPEIERLRREEAERSGA